MLAKRNESRVVRVIRTLRLNFREGSTGAEIISAMLKVSLTVTWLLGQANPNSTLFSLIGGVKFGPWCILGIGLFHILAWTQPPVLPWLAIRKGACCVGLAMWTSILYDLTRSGSTATIILILPLVVMLGVAVFRRTYTVV